MRQETRSQLESRKHDVYDAIRTLDGDRRDGLIDADAYWGARSRYESEAAAILQHLDALEDCGPVLPQAGKVDTHRRLLMMGTGGVVLLAIALFLGGALHARTGTAAITGDVGQATPAPTAGRFSAVVAARNLVKIHPRDITAELQLATAYANVNDTDAANGAYLNAIGLAPHRAEARTLYAMFQGSAGNSNRALAQLAFVEHAHPAYAKAWLIDGLLSSRLSAGLPRAIVAWRRFLVLAPHASIAPQVRALLNSAVRAQKHRR